MRACEKKGGRGTSVKWETKPSTLAEDVFGRRCGVLGGNRCCCVCVYFVSVYGFPKIVAATWGVEQRC